MRGLQPAQFGHPVQGRLVLPLPQQPLGILIQRSNLGLASLFLFLGLPLLSQPALGPRFHLRHISISGLQTLHLFAALEGCPPILRSQGRLRRIVQTGQLGLLLLPALLRLPLRS